MRPCLILLLLIFSLGAATAQSGQNLLIDARHRPPDMMVDPANQQVSGPLVDIIAQALAEYNRRHQTAWGLMWRVAPFARSLTDLAGGRIDLVPRLVWTAEREDVVRFLGPITTEQRDLRFAVTPGKAASLRTIKDLEGRKIGVKRGTAYQEGFDKNPAITKVSEADDPLLVRRLSLGMVDAVIVMDTEPFEQTAKQAGVSFVWAELVIPNNLPVYYGFSKKSAHAALADELDNILKAMAASGKVAAVYRSWAKTPAK